jgi:rhodanese-related sulfurtransferase
LLLPLNEALILNKLPYMKNVSFLLLLLTFFSSYAQTDSLKTDANSFEKGLTNPGIQILDVRTSGEYNSGHIKNALLADWTNKEQFNQRIQYVDKDRPVYIYCLSGGRSSAAASWMRSNGFNKVVELEGGINAWKLANKPVESISTEKQMTPDEYWAAIPKNKTTLVDFGATWCPPCVKMEPVINELRSNANLNFQFIKIDASINTDVMHALKIEPIPVFIIYKNGNEVWRQNGVVTKEELIKHLQ